MARRRMEADLRAVIREAARVEAGRVFRPEADGGRMLVAPSHRGSAGR